MYRGVRLSLSELEGVLPYIDHTGPGGTGTQHRRHTVGRPGTSQTQAAATESRHGRECYACTTQYQTQQWAHGSCLACVSRTTMTCACTECSTKHIPSDNKPQTVLRVWLPTTSVTVHDKLFLIYYLDYNAPITPPSQTLQLKWSLCKHMPDSYLSIIFSSGIVHEPMNIHGKSKHVIW